GLRQAALARAQDPGCLRRAPGAGRTRGRRCLRAETLRFGGHRGLRPHAHRKSRMTAAAPRPADAGTIIVGEGEVLVRLAIASYLRECRYRVIEAASAEEIVAVLDDAEVAVDLVLCDIAIPGERNGIAM